LHSSTGIRFLTVSVAAYLGAVRTTAGAPARLAWRGAALTRSSRAQPRPDAGWCGDTGDLGVVHHRRRAGRDDPGITDRGEQPAVPLIARDGSSLSPASEHVNSPWRTGITRARRRSTAIRGTMQCRGYSADAVARIGV